MHNESEQLKEFLLSALFNKTICFGSKDFYSHSRMGEYNAGIALQEQEKGIKPNYVSRKGTLALDKFCSFYIYFNSLLPFSDLADVVCSRNDLKAQFV